MGAVADTSKLLGSVVLEERLQKIDRDVNELERDIEMMNKQIGKKLQKVRLLKEERTKVSEAYKNALK